MAPCLRGYHGVIWTDAQSFALNSDGLNHFRCLGTPPKFNNPGLERSIYRLTYDWRIDANGLN
jgi:hypothetical protein